MIEQVTSAEAADRYLPQPAVAATGAFQDFIEIARGVVAGVFEKIPAVIGEVPTGATGSFAELINAQLQAQIEMQTTTLVSNIERSKHESKMAAIRNIRVG